MKKSKIIIVSVCFVLCLCTMAVASIETDFLNLKPEKSGLNPLNTVTSSVTQTRNAPNGKSYDLSVTTFNVGGFAAGIDDGIHTSAKNYGPLKAINDWKSLLDYNNGFVNHNLKSDLYNFNEFSKTLWNDDAGLLEGDSKGETVMTKDVFEKIFPFLHMHSGVNTGSWGAAYSNMAFASHNLTVTDITYGTLSGKYPDNRRAYMKGYINVKGERIAFYSVHLGYFENSGDVTADSYYELIDLMNDDEYCIVCGDMNSTTVHEYMTEAGYKCANRGEFGDINTFINDAAQSAYIDNIFVSPNIDIEYAFSNGDVSYRAYSDHFPLTAYLTVNPGAAGVTPKINSTADDGYTTEYR